MPVEFALRPRIRLREDAPLTVRRRARLRLPRFTLHVVAYWAAVGGICFAIIRAHDAPAAPELEPRALTEQPEQAPPAETSPAALAPKPEPEPEPEQPSVALAAPSTDDADRDDAASNAGRAAALPSQGSLHAALDERALPEPARAARSGDAAEPGSAQESAPFPPELALGALNDGERPEPAPSNPPALSPPSRGGGSLPSCEAAAAAATQRLDFASSDRTADLSSAVIAGVLENGAWLSTCSVPESTKLEVCVAIQGGHVTAATVVSNPPDHALNACVKQRAAALQFPYSARVDIARTRF